ncbi:MAG: 2-oxo-4-hydroxy-4-carboxy-5-ureidoimidazoline decarboxylase [Rhodospirillales bacterium]|nr:2-oxo-4-hydroxy-4-carboxy-5-ureidoimidazoline decarboxylase [Rhodospirillales bacterium]
MAVKGLRKEQILAAFQDRVNNDRETEFSTSCQQVERIALLRLEDLLA